MLKAPCVILEPFFGTNKKEWSMFQESYGKQQLGKAIAISINKCFSDWGK
jgi:N-acetylmuramoyl-L-alanine amidase